MYYICFCKQTKTKKMSKIIDIEALSKMPITDEFAKMLFGVSNSNLIKVIYEPPYLTYKNKAGCEVNICENGTFNTSQSWISIFKIVRYIDNYLRLNNHNESVEQSVQSAFNLLKINKKD